MTHSASETLFELRKQSSQLFRCSPGFAIGAKWDHHLLHRHHLPRSTRASGTSAYQSRVVELIKQHVKRCVAHLQGQPSLNVKMGCVRRYRTVASTKILARKFARYHHRHRRHRRRHHHRPRKNTSVAETSVLSPSLEGLTKRHARNSALL